MRNNYLFAILSAFLLWLGWPPFPYSSILLFVGFVPLLFAIEQVLRGSYTNKGRKVFTLGFLTGVLWNTASIYWVYNSLNAYLSTTASLLIALIPFCLAPLLMGLVFNGYYRLRKSRDIRWSFLGLTSFWMAYEYLHQTWELQFPWMTLGNGFANFHQLIQWYEYTGVYGGTLWIWGANILFFLLAWQYKHKRQAISSRGLAITAAVWIVLPASFSIGRYSSYEEHINPSEVVVVQPNIDPFGKVGAIDPSQQLNILMDLSAKVGKPNTEFFIWPETAISSRGGINEDTFRDHTIYTKLFDFLDNYHNGNILSGIESYRIYQDQATLSAQKYDEGIYIDHFNAAVLIDQSSKLQFYHKSKLVPGVEHLPFGSVLAFMKPLFAHFGGSTGGYGSQKEPSVFYSASGIGAAPVICYESIWGNYVTQYVKKGAQFIAIITNDGWWGNTSGKDQHLQYAKLRAIENRRWVARSANTGISGFINQRGDIVQKTEWWTPASLTQEINLNEEITFYTIYQDLIAYLFIVIAIIFATLLILTRRKIQENI